jgi:hypothetical protein
MKRIVKCGVEQGEERRFESGKGVADKAGQRSRFKKFKECGHALVRFWKRLS